ncbi:MULTISPECIES: 4-hydroxyphenylpyruvate dioxygenase [Trichocoleus]|uniref:4-hydroxyphenylpyruvate dioxygenase n=1 Tax=Trichocoleus desertorum GB2-A4 TaxID=2933944 RepID=A0ABV0JAZ4_9CYAN|nr:4-hydroxyphenylpyruvate dioxygenase [Trichocoleus sp. FACHB-46]MBD1863199.1 4-hydroxyphenylpyruvate dioxygenase [Trichocoleus sp. FACHB-46]
MHDICPIKRFDHLEFYVGNAKQAALFYADCFGFTNTAYRGLSTGSRDVTSYVMEQGEIRLVLSSALHPDHAIAQSGLKHGDSVAVIALEVPDAEKAFWETTSRGAREAIALTEEQDEQGVFRYAVIHVYGDMLVKFVERSQYQGFAPGFAMRQQAHQRVGAGLTAIDHVVANVEYGAMDRWVQFFTDTLGFELLMHFDDQAISTEYSALMSKVMRDRTGKIKLPINEPAYGKRKSQIDEFLEYHHGPGIQHIALATNNIIETVTQLKRSGVEFLQTPPTYYQNLASRVGALEEPIDQLAQLGILIDRDSEGYLLQIFTQPVQDRPTLFFEIIQRHGAQGFGEGNFKALFEAIEREQALRGNL